MRGVFWAPMVEVGIHQHITGSAFGIGRLLGYAPGMFPYIIYGAILDHFPGQQRYNCVPPDEHTGHCGLHGVQPSLSSGAQKNHAHWRFGAVQA